jgi:hypothetical protein
MAAFCQEPMRSASVAWEAAEILGCGASGDRDLATEIRQGLTGGISQFRAIELTVSKPPPGAHG